MKKLFKVAQRYHHLLSFSQKSDFYVFVAVQQLPLTKEAQDFIRAVHEGIFLLGKMRVDSQKVNSRTTTYAGARKLAIKVKRFLESLDSDLWPIVTISVQDKAGDAMLEIYAPGEPDPQPQEPMDAEEKDPPLLA